MTILEGVFPTWEQGVGKYPNEKAEGSAFLTVVK